MYELWQHDMNPVAIVIGLLLSCVLSYSKKNVVLHTVKEIILYMSTGTLR